MGAQKIQAGKAPSREHGDTSAAPVQRFAAPRAFAADSAEAHPGVLRPSSGGAPLPAAVREKMETAFGHDFGGVRVHHGGEAESIGAAAYTRGAHLHFAPGRFQPHSEAGQRLIGHELAHVVQQRAGRVANPGGAVPVNDAPHLEREADAAGARAAAGHSMGAITVNSAGPTSAVHTPATDHGPPQSARGEAASSHAPLQMSDETDRKYGKGADFFGGISAGYGIRQSRIPNRRVKALLGLFGGAAGLIGNAFKFKSGDHLGAGRGAFNNIRDMHKDYRTFKR